MVVYKTQVLYILTKKPSLDLHKCASYSVPLLFTNALVSFLTNVLVSFLTMWHL